ncbi:MAG: HTTM domain-containing protein [Polyangiaceae bacterium]
MFSWGSRTCSSCVTTYLNHYYLVSLLAGLIAFLPMNAAWSLDARLAPRVRRAHVPWAVFALRFQVAVVYTFAGLAKVNADAGCFTGSLSECGCRAHGDAARGPLFALPGAALAMSWAGCLFDLTIAVWLSVRRTRLAAYRGGARLTRSPRRCSRSGCSRSSW